MPPKKTMGQIQEEKRVEQQIQQVYEESPVKVQKKPGIKKPYYAPTPKQQQQIIELAEQLPPEKRAKYITYEEPKAEPKGIAETLMGTVIDVRTKVPISTIEELTGEKGVPRWFPIAPAYGFAAPVGAGTVASVESLVYGGERLVSHFVTHHEPITPKPPPTQISGIIGASLGDPTEIHKVEEYGPFYAAGTVAGDILLSYVTGKGMEKAWAGLKKIPIVKKAPLAAESLKHGVMETIMKKAPERLQKWYYGPYYKEWKISQKLVWEKPPFAGYKEFYLTTETMLPTRPPAEQWLLQTRGTPTTPFSKTLEAAISKGGGMGGLAATQQVVVTKYAKLSPFEMMYYPVSDVSVRTGESLIKNLLVGASLVGLKGLATQHLKPYPSAELISYPVSTPTIKPIIDSASIVSPIMSPIVSPVQDVKVSQVQEVTQIQRQQLKQLQIQRQSLVRQQIQIPDWLMLDRPTRRRRKKKGTKPSGFYGRYPRFYPVKGARETLEMLVGI